LTSDAFSIECVTDCQPELNLSCLSGLQEGDQMIEYGFMASQSTGFMSGLVDFWNGLPLWPTVGGVAAFTLLLFWSVFKK